MQRISDIDRMVFKIEINLMQHYESLLFYIKWLDLKLKGPFNLIFKSGIIRSNSL